MRSRALLAVTAAVALLASGCTSDGGADSAGAPSGTAEHSRLRPFRAAEAAPPAGAEVVQCSDLRSRRNTGLAVRFVVPDGFTGGTRDAGSCDFTGGSFARELTVSFGPMESLASVKERDLDPVEDVGGDDSVSDIAYAADVPVYGDHRGERLDYYCYCDGQDLDERVVQARGVRVHWTTPHGKDPREDEFDAVRAGLSLRRSAVSTCGSAGRTATFRPPVPQTESIDVFEGRCHLYLQPGRGSLQRMAEVVPMPSRTLETTAAGLERRKRFVHDVRLEHDVTMLDGKSADRLTWLFTRRTTSPYNEPAGTWRLVTLGTSDLQVTWGGRPRQWRQEADVVRRFVDSVHLLPMRR